MRAPFLFLTDPRPRPASSDRRRVSLDSHSRRHQTALASARKLTGRSQKKVPRHLGKVHGHVGNVHRHFGSAQRSKRTERAAARWQRGRSKGAGAANSPPDHHPLAARALAARRACRRQVGGARRASQGAPPQVILVMPVRSFRFSLLSSYTETLSFRAKDPQDGPGS